jgi:sodium/potassium-transporting ATPase subunit alpha
LLLPSLVTIKGAPDILIERCGSIIDREGNVQALNAHTLDTVKELKDRWSSEGKRVILLARKVVQAKDLSSHPTSTAYESEVIRHVRTGLILVGLVGIVDPPREEIPEVVKTLRRAGIRMFMVGSPTERFLVKNHLANVNFDRLLATLD